MEIINGTSLSDKCDYSFGDHLGVSAPEHIIGGFMKPANISNAEFILFCQKNEGKVLSLFIDNIRLYNRPVYANEGQDAEWVKYLLTYNDLLALCVMFPKNRLVIFCSHEDTPIDEHIKIPENVLGIHAVNAGFFGNKIHPFPYGAQRQLGKDDHRISILKSEIDKHQVPTKLLYINCGIERNKEREYLVNFEGRPWCTTRFDKDSKYFPYDRYLDFLTELRDHKFMICPQGHGMDCHRNWESLYMRRVPVMLEHPYFRELMKGFPVLFVEDWRNINKELLEKNDHLFKQAQEMSLKRLDLGFVFSTIMASYGRIIG